MAQPSLWKPMLAAKPEPEELDNVIQSLQFPLLGSYKYDGIRATVQNGQLLSRSLKPIRNTAMQVRWRVRALDLLDGEIICGEPTAEDCFNQTSSQVMSTDGGLDNAKYYVFDLYKPGLAFESRIMLLKQAVQGIPDIVYVKQVLLKNVAQLLKFEEEAVGKGHEGIMVRDPAGAYKQGRSTLRERGLIAIKRFVDAEAVIQAVYEQKENRNEKKTNALGHSERSSHKTNKVGKDTLGGFTVQMRMAKGAPLITFNVATGTGLTDVRRKQLWERKSDLVGATVKLRYQKIGTMDAPRIPTFVGFRDPIDL